MMKRLCVLALASCFASAPCYADIIIETNDQGQYEMAWQGVSVSVDIVSTYDNIFETTLSVNAGDDAIIFDAVESFMSPPSIRMVELDPTNDTPEILVSAYSGGAHCCEELVAFSNVDNIGWEKVEIGTFDARTAPNTPMDLDGDGSAEFALGDDRFLYEFASYADSFVPPRILALRGYDVLDQTKEPGFADHIAQALNDLGKAPESGEARNSWLASYAAILLLQKQDDPLDFATSTFDADVDWGMMQCTDKTKDEGSCPKDQLINIGFEGALSDFLVETGYLEPAQ